MALLILSCYGLTAIAALGFGITYLLTPTFMPYHAQALGLGWDELPANLQVLILALLRVAGGGLCAASVAVLALLIGPFRQGQRWAYQAVPIICLLVVVPTFRAVWSVQQQTMASPPLGLVGLCLGLILLGAGLSWGRGVAQ